MNNLIKLLKKLIIYKKRIMTAKQTVQKYSELAFRGLDNGLVISEQDLENMLNDFAESKCKELKGRTAQIIAEQNLTIQDIVEIQEKIYQL